jgi:hypothetical protein
MRLYDPKAEALTGERNAAPVTRVLGLPNVTAQ